MNRLAVALLALALPACSIINKPCAAPCPPGSTCIAGVCVVTAPPPVEPPPVEPPPVEPPPVEPPPVEPPPVEPPPTNYCASALDPALSPPVLKDAEWTADGVSQSPQMSNAVQAAIRKAQTNCGRAWADNRCLMLGVAGIDAAYRDIARELQGAGIVAAQGVNDANPKADHLTVGRPGTSEYEEWKLFAYTDGCLTQNQYKNAFRPKSAPPVSGACPHEPCPLKVWTAETLPPGWGENEIGKAAWEWKARQHTMGNADSTPVVKRQEPFCRAIGLSPYADGQPRASCPVRPDGHSEREAVENWLLDGGPKRDSRNGQDCRPNNTDNPFAFLYGTGNCRICNATKTTCSEWL